MLEERGSFTQEFELEIERRNLTHEYILHLVSMLNLPESFAQWDESKAWQFLRADLSHRARAALLAANILDSEFAMMNSGLQ